MTEKRSKSEAAEAPDDLSYEAALRRLEEVVAELEGGKLSLEDSLARVEEGVRLRNFCQQKLKSVDLRIEKLLADNGKLVARPLDEDD